MADREWHRAVLREIGAAPSGLVTAATPAPAPAPAPPPAPATLVEHPPAPVAHPRALSASPPPAPPAPAPAPTVPAPAPTPEVAAPDPAPALAGPFVHTEGVVGSDQPAQDPAGDQQHVIGAEPEPTAAAEQETPAFSPESTMLDFGPRAMRSIAERAVAAAENTGVPPTIDVPDDSPAPPPIAPPEAEPTPPPEPAVTGDLERNATMVFQRPPSAFGSAPGPDGGPGPGPDAGPSLGAPGPNAGPGLGGPGPNAGPSLGGPGPDAGPTLDGPGPNAGPGLGGPGPDAGPTLDGPGPNAGPGLGGPGPGNGPGLGGPGPNAGPGLGGPGPDAGPSLGGPGPNAGPGGPGLGGQPVGGRPEGVRGPVFPAADAPAPRSSPWYAESSPPQAAPERPMRPYEGEARQQEVLGVIGEPVAPQQPPAFTELQAAAPAAPDFMAAAPAPPAEGLVRRNVHGDPLMRRLGVGVRRAVGGGAASETREQTELAERLSGRVSVCRQISVVSVRGGAGKTTLAALVAATISEHRGDRVLAVDADSEMGSLPLRLGIPAQRSIHELAAASPRTWEETEPYLGRPAERLWVLPGSPEGRLTAELDLATFQTAFGGLARFFSAAVVDCGAGILGALQRGVSQTAHAQLLVTPATVDGALSARGAVEWFGGNGHAALLQRTVIVLVTHTQHTDADLDRVREMLSSGGLPVMHLPYDRHLATGTSIDMSLLGGATRSAAARIAAEVFVRSTGA